MWVVLSMMLLSFDLDCVLGCVGLLIIEGVDEFLFVLGSFGMMLFKLLLFLFELLLVLLLVLIVLVGFLIFK